MRTPYDDKLLKAGLNAFEIRRVVPEARRATRGTWYINLLQWVLVIVLIAGFVAVLIGVILTVRIDHLISAIGLVVALIASFLLPPMLLLRIKRQRTLQAAIRLANELDSRYCPRCGYEVRASDSTIDCCPECGTYISRRERVSRPPLVVRTVDGTGWVADELFWFPDALELTPGQIEDMMLQACGFVKAPWYASAQAQSFYLTALFVSILIARKQLDALPAWQQLSIVVTPFVLVYLCLFLFGRWRAERRAEYVRHRLRPLLLEAGCRECPGCSDFLGPNQKACAVCNPTA